MRGRRVGVVASTSALLAVIVLVVGLVLAAPVSSTFVVGSVVGAVVALVVGLLTGSGIVVGAAYVLAGAAGAASILSDGVGPLRAAVAGLVFFASAELTRLSLDARQPCRFDRRVLERLAGRAALTAGAVAGLLLVVALAGELDVPRLAVPVGVAGTVAVAGVLVAAGRSALDDTWRRVGAAVAVLAVVGVALVASVAVEQGRSDAAPAAEEEVVASPPADGDGGQVEDEELSPGTVLTMRLMLLVVLGVLALLLGGVLLLPGADLTLDPYELDPDDALLLSGGTIADLEEVADEVGAEAVAAIDGALADLTGDLEPGLAVRLAYDRVQSGFGDAALARRATESEAEYLGRLLTTLGVSAAAMGRLTDLFEQARFSEHPIDERMRSDAVDAFGEVRAELVARSPVAGTTR